MSSGPFITAYISGSNTDPSGTGSGTLFFRQQRPDRVANGNSSHRTRTQWFNPNAFACPGSTGFASLQNGACDVGGIDADRAFDRMPALARTQRLTSEIPNPSLPVSHQFVEQRLPLFQVCSIEAFSEPAVNRSEQFASLLRLGLVTPKARNAHRGCRRDVGSSRGRVYN